MHCITNLLTYQDFPFAKICVHEVIVEQAKQARHSQVCSIEIRNICVYYTTYVIFAL